MPSMKILVPILISSVLSPLSPAQIPTGKGWTANVCFGGTDMKTLFVTAMDSLFTIEMR